ncbi:protein CANDIDATE G-PROTEIN COUPLED RECEPTOR 7-like [Macadamia integrifolia]|uniref:protein CANDIDATE G-PROTEIN COUPLED RECEPTOR 7-like n=1 Tax=Macadamia integrifolia TaxID=60698 RepID=UPI001C4E3027|nr:protein CANDIDATE G-PROTEIN COUPLED RECEPTOR 7-like [Macadamia integrifolia]
MGSFHLLAILHDHHHHHNPFKLLQLLPILCIISSIPFSASEIQNTQIVEDSRSMILFERFGFVRFGHVSISIKDVSWRSKHPNAELDPSLMGFFLLRESAYGKIFNESEYTDHFCILSSHYVKLLFKFDQLNLNSTYNGTIIVDYPDEYDLVFGNCLPEFEVSMDVHTEMYNMKNGKKDFLSSGLTQLPTLYFIFFIIYSVLFLIWVYICVNQRPTVDKIHLIIGALFIVKALKMICASEDFSFVKRTGTPHGWDVLFYIFSFLKGIMLFTVIILIGTGWSFLKPYLQEREKKVLMIVIPLQVLENIASVVIGESGPALKDWMTWNQLFLLMDIICCCLVFFPIIWSIRSLREASKTDGKAARNLAKLSLFKQFYIVVVGYLYFTRVVVSAIGAIIDYKFKWFIVAVGEGASLAFYLFIFFNFQPKEKNPYFVIDDEEEASAAKELEEDDSFEL